VMFLPLSTPPKIEACNGSESIGSGLQILMFTAV